MKVLVLFFIGLSFQVFSQDDTPIGQKQEDFYIGVPNLKSTFESKLKVIDTKNSEVSPEGSSSKATLSKAESDEILKKLQRVVEETDRKYREAREELNKYKQSKRMLQYNGSSTGGINMKQVYKNGNFYPYMLSDFCHFRYERAEIVCVAGGLDTKEVVYKISSDNSTNGEDPKETGLDRGAGKSGGITVGDSGEEQGSGAQGIE